MTSDETYLYFKRRKVTGARDKLATNYLRGTKWFYANESDPDVIEAADVEHELEAHVELVVGRQAEVDARNA